MKAAFSTRFGAPAFFFGPTQLDRDSSPAAIRGLKAAGDRLKRRSGT
jgi:hypothetical protein